MGREIKRTPVGFNWPLGQVWGGFVNPHYKDRRECPFCKGCGYNEATTQLSEDWYDFEKTGRRWHDALTQDEVDALVAHGRLWEFWRRPTAEGWQDIEPRPQVLAADVNAKQRGGGILTHDAINRHICIETRARRLGIFGECEVCKGKGELWRTPEAEAAAETWEREEPPAGDGWQLWETVSEGSPVSPSFRSAEELARWLCLHERLPGGGYLSEERWLAFIQGPGWAPSLMGNTQGIIRSGVEAMTEPGAPTPGKEQE